MMDRRRGHKRGHGEGSIDQQADGRWRARLMVGYKPDGNPDRRAVYGKTRAECQSKLDDLRRRASGGTLGTSTQERETVAAFLERWLATAETRVRPKSHRRYREIVGLYLIPGLGKHKLTGLRPDHIQTLYADMLKAGKSPSLVTYTHVILSGALKQAARWGLIPYNPCNRVDPPRASRKEIVPPTAEQVDVLLDSAGSCGDRLAALWTVAAYSGCRLGELLALRWTDVDTERGTISIHRTLAGSKGGVPQFSEPKTSSSRRTIKLDRDALDALRAHRDRQDFERRRLGDDYAGHGLVFCTRLGTAMGKKEAGVAFKKLLARAGLPTTIRFHDLRHAHASMLVRAGVHAKAMSARLGHAKIAITLDLYSHITPEQDADAAALVGDVLRRARRT
jgi:integrase